MSCADSAEDELQCGVSVTRTINFSRQHQISLDDAPGQDVHLFIDFLKYLGLED